MGYWLIPWLRNREDGNTKAGIEDSYKLIFKTESTVSFSGNKQSIEVTRNLSKYSPVHARIQERLLQNLKCRGLALPGCYIGRSSTKRAKGSRHIAGCV